MLLITDIRCYKVNTQELKHQLDSLQYGEKQIAYLVKKKNTEPAFVRSQYGGSKRNPNYIGTTMPDYIKGIEANPYYCKIGYYDKKSRKFLVRELLIGNIIITKIFLWEYVDEGYLRTCYSVFMKEQSQELESRIDFVDNISYFFWHCIPELNERISRGEQLAQINLEKFAGAIHSIYTSKDDSTIKSRAIRL